MLPATDHVARTCKKSSLDPVTRRPTPASFEFRLKEGKWHDVYLSVNWLEFLSPGNDSLPTKIERLRAFQLGNAQGLQLVKPTVNNAYAVLAAATVQSARLEQVGTTLECRHEPMAEGDPHSGVYPNPGTDHWPTNGDAPAHLAVQQFLFQSMCYWERGIP